MRRRNILLFMLTAIFALGTGCASGDRPLEAVDPDAVVAEPTYDQVYAIIQNKCVLCHDGSGEDDLVVGAVAEDDAPGLESCTSIYALRFDILQRVEDNTMPPGALPRLSSEEKLIIRRWVDNGAPAPCKP